jgi:hypothetical protein
MQDLLVPQLLLGNAGCTEAPASANVVRQYVTIFKKLTT